MYMQFYLIKLIKYSLELWFSTLLTSTLSSTIFESPLVLVLQLLLIDRHSYFL